MASGTKRRAPTAFSPTTPTPARADAGAALLIGYARVSTEDQRLDRAGRLLPSAILRRLATYSRKNRLYFAFRELGRVIRTDFLLRYLGSIELRRAIGAATNKSELFNRYAQWVAFGSSGLTTAATRDEQRKMVKYNHLIANLLIFHTAIGMMRALDEIAADEHGAAITPEALAGTSPYLNEHLNRFGSYELDLSKPPVPLPFELPDRLRPSRQGATAPV